MRWFWKEEVLEGESFGRRKSGAAERFPAPERLFLPLRNPFFQCFPSFFRCVSVVAPQT